MASSENDRTDGEALTRELREMISILRMRGETEEHIARQVGLELGVVSEYIEGKGMGDEGEYWRDVREARRERRDELGVSCPGCPKVQPKRIPTVLLPGQKCKVCGYRDPRKRET